MVPIFIIVRRSKNFQVCQQIDLDHIAHRTSHKEAIERCNQWWIDIYNKEWAEIRRNIADITIAHAVVCGPDGIILNSETEISIPQDSWIVPIDDDDLVDPRLIKFLRNKKPVEIVKWNTNRLKSKKLGHIDSNEYALPGSILEHNYDLMMRHAQVEKHNYRIIDKNWGVKVDHPACMGKMKNYKTKNMMEREINKFLASDNNKFPKIFRQPLDRIKEAFKYE